MVIFLVKKWLYFLSKHGNIFGTKNGYIFDQNMVIFLVKKMVRFLVKTWFYFWSKHGYIFGQNSLLISSYSIFKFKI